MKIATPIAIAPNITKVVVSEKANIFLICDCEKASC